MRLLRVSRALASCALFTVFAFLALAQEATIVGTVTDPSGAVVPNAAITITNTGKNQSRQIASGDNGQFVIPDLLIGHYTVHAEAPGFKAFEQSGIVLAVGDRARVDVKLELGSNKESTTVEADAVAVRSESGGGGMDIMPSVDAIAEFRILTSNYSSEYGLSSSATMTMVFESGTKDFHGKAWEFVRNDALDAGNYFTNAAGTKAPELRFNTYGFQVAGPVFIPKVYNKNRDKTFFMYNMEWRKLVQGGLVNQTVPVTSEYGGQFNSPINIPTNVAGIQATLPAGLTAGTPFPGNKIPASMLNPNALSLLQAGIFPTANNGSQFVGGNKLPTNLREEIVRIDHRFNDKFSIFGHWVSESVSQTYGTSQWGNDNVPTVGDVFNNPAYHTVLHATYSISPTLINEVAFNSNGNQITIAPNGVYQRPSNLHVPELFPGNNLNRIPAVALGQLGTNYDVGSWPWHNKADDYQVRNDLSWTKGSH